MPTPTKVGSQPTPASKVYYDRLLNNTPSNKFKVYADREIDPEFYKKDEISAEDDPFVKSLVEEISKEIDEEAADALANANPDFLGAVKVEIEERDISSVSRKLRSTWSIEEGPARAPKFIGTQEELIREFGQPEFDRSVLEASFDAVRKSDVLMGFKGRQTLETGYFYAPYIPIFSTPYVLGDPLFNIDWEAVFDLDSPLLSRLGFVIPKQKKQYPLPLELYGWVFPLCADLSRLRREADEIREKNKKIEDDLEVYSRMHKEFSLNPWRGADRLFPTRELDLT